MSLKEKIEEFEKQLIDDALTMSKTKLGASKILGIKRTTLVEKIKKHKLDNPQICLPRALILKKISEFQTNQAYGFLKKNYKDIESLSRELETNRKWIKELEKFRRDWAECNELSKKLSEEEKKVGNF